MSKLILVTVISFCCIIGWYVGKVLPVEKAPESSTIAAEPDAALTTWEDVTEQPELLGNPCRSIYWFPVNDMEQTCPEGLRDTGLPYQLVERTLWMPCVVGR